jgi:uncharacterized membrane protein
MVDAKKDENLMAAIAYVLGWVTGLIMYLMHKDKSKYVSFHGVQSIILNVVEIPVFVILMFGVMIVGGVAGAVTMGIGTLLIPMGMLVLFCLFIAITVFMMYKAYKGEKYKLPFIGDLAEKYA